MTVDLITLIDDHAERAQRDVYSQWWQDPVFMALVDAFAGAIQMFEEIAFDAIVSTGLELATGRDLRVWGRYVGEKQGALAEHEYRAIIRGRILARASNSTVVELAEVLRAAADGVHVVGWDLVGPNLALTVYRESPMSDAHRARVRLVLDDAKKAGVQLVLAEAIVDATIVYDTGPGWDYAQTAELI